ncbi:MAG: hypothetical protein GY834_08255 [Bacteroidetes bacterium]|nr:hypothetical protein [Bacteroidota bacterium]
MALKGKSSKIGNPSLQIEEYIIELVNPKYTMRLFVVGVLDGYRKGNVWELQGVYDTEEQAVENCFDVNCFVGPIELNVPTQSRDDLSEPWPGAWYPKLEERPKDLSCS